MAQKKGISNLKLNDRNLIEILETKDTNLLPWGKDAAWLCGVDDFNDTKKLKEVWQDILKRALFFLRINDQRERGFLVSSNSSSPAPRKTTMTKAALKAMSQNLYGLEALFEYFDTFEEFERVLYGAEAHYRDHIAHTLRVWLTGLHILSEFGTEFSARTADDVIVSRAPYNSPKLYSTEKGGNNRELQLSTAELSAMWAIVALTHDLGYPLEKVDRLNSRLEDMVSKFGRIGFSPSQFSFQTQHDHLVRLLLSIISSTAKKCPQRRKSPPKWFTHVRTKYLAKFSKSWESFHHGLVSSLLLFKSLTYFLESDFCNDEKIGLEYEDARQFMIRAEILHSIAAHTTPKVYHLYANTLPFLLILCDDLQEWGRPTFDEMKTLRKKTQDVEVALKLCHISQDKSTIEVEVKYPGEEDPGLVCRGFNNWHERLRLALDDSKRNMNFSWKVDFKTKTKKTRAPYTFSLDNTLKVFEQIQIRDKGNRNVDLRKLD